MPVHATVREKIAEKSATWEKWWSGGGSNGSITGYLNWLFYKPISVIPHSVPHPSTLLQMDGDGLSEHAPFDGFPAAPCGPKMRRREFRGGSFVLGSIPGFGGRGLDPVTEIG